MNVLPDDAYALLLLVEHDLSKAQRMDAAAWLPSTLLDTTPTQSINRTWSEDLLGWRLIVKHTFTKHYISRSSSAENANDIFVVSPMLSSLFRIHDAVPWSDKSLSPTALSGLWLGRVCPTTSHELSHCFGMEHCVCFTMSASCRAVHPLRRDARQPPYLSTT